MSTRGNLFLLIFWMRKEQTRRWMVFFLDESIGCREKSELGKTTIGRWIIFSGWILLEEKEWTGEEDNWEEINDFFWGWILYGWEKKSELVKKTTGRWMFSFWMNYIGWEKSELGKKTTGDGGHSARPRVVAEKHSHCGAYSSTYLAVPSSRNSRSSNSDFAALPSLGSAAWLPALSNDPTFAENCSGLS